MGQDFQLGLTTNIIHSSNMKTIVLVLVLVAVASAQFGGPHQGGLGGLGGAAGRAAAGGAGVGGGVGTGAGGLFGPPKNYGPKVYGPGANNRFAFPPNAFLMQRTLSLVNQVPGALIFLDTDGEISITDRFGREADIIHPLGFNLSEQFD